MLEELLAVLCVSNEQVLEVEGISSFVLVNSKRFHAILEFLFKGSLMLLHEVVLKADFIAIGEVLGRLLVEELMIELVVALWQCGPLGRLGEIWAQTAGSLDVLTREQIEIAEFIKSIEHLLSAFKFIIKSGHSYWHINHFSHIDLVFSSSFV